MKHYLIVDSRDLTEYVNGSYLPLVVKELREKGHEVTVFLIENGVIAAREGSKMGQVLDALSRNGARILAEDVSCLARGVNRLSPGISLANLDLLADSIAGGFDNILWY
jgi:sulfur transfer complex TusBCD TusB component (DsrH family)